MFHFLSGYHCNTYCPPDTLSPKNCLHVEPQGLLFSRNSPPSLHLCLSCVENSKAWGSYNGGLLTGLSGYPHCFRKDTKCPPLGVQWRSVEGILYKEQDVSTTEPYFFGNAKSSQTVLCHEFKTDPMNLFGKICAFTDVLPNSINVCIAPQEVIEVRVKPAAAFMLMNSLVRTFWTKLNYSSS